MSWRLQMRLVLYYGPYGLEQVIQFEILCPLWLRKNNSVDGDSIFKPWWWGCICNSVNGDSIIELRWWGSICNSVDGDSVFEPRWWGFNSVDGGSVFEPHWWDCVCNSVDGDSVFEPRWWGFNSVDGGSIFEPRWRSCICYFVESNSIFVATASYRRRSDYAGALSVTIKYEWILPILTRVLPYLAQMTSANHMSIVHTFSIYYVQWLQKAMFQLHSLSYKKSHNIYCIQGPKTPIYPER